jgi:hypothetical protein
MKRTLLALALVSTTGLAGADEYLEPVIVEHVDGYHVVEYCTPPTAALECAGFHAMIRQSFSDREIAMLFGSATANPAYRTSYDRVRERYDNLVRYVEDNGVVPAVGVGTIETIPAAPAIGEPAAYYYEDTYVEPARSDAVIDDDAVYIDADDPDAALLRTPGSDLYPNADPDSDVVYYDDNTLAKQ